MELPAKPKIQKSFIYRVFPTPMGQNHSSVLTSKNPNFWSFPGVNRRNCHQFEGNAVRTDNYFLYFIFFYNVLLSLGYRRGTFKYLHIGCEQSNNKKERYYTMALNFGFNGTVNNDNQLVIDKVGYMVNDEVIKVLNNLHTKHPEWFTRAEWADKTVDRQSKKPQQRQYTTEFDPSKYTKSWFLDVDEPLKRDKATYVVVINWIKSGSNCFADYGKGRQVKPWLIREANEQLTLYKGNYDKDRHEYLFTTKTSATKFANAMRCISADRQKAQWAKGQKRKEG